jgi:hypothetical protein
VRCGPARLALRSSSKDPPRNAGAVPLRAERSATPTMAGATAMTFAYGGPPCLGPISDEA